MKIEIPSIKKINVEIKDFSKGLQTVEAQNIMQLSSTPNYYNYNLNSGALVRGFGFRRFHFLSCADNELTQGTPDDDYPTETYYHAWHYKVFSNIYHERRDKLILISSTNKMYYCWLFTQYHFIVRVDTALSFTKAPFTLNFKYNDEDYSLICADDEGFWYLQDGYIAQQVAAAPQISCICTHKDLIFMVVTPEKYTLRITNNRDFTTWSTALSTGEIEIEMDSSHGQILMLLSFMGNVFAFRDYGITKITTYSTVSDVNLSHIFSAGGKINKKTITIAGDRVLFLCKDGLYSFDGVDTTKIDIGVNRKIDTKYNDKAVATYHNGKYYLACRLKYDDDNVIGSENTAGYINNSLVIYDLNSKSVNIVRGVDITSMTTLQERAMDKVVFCFRSDYNSFVGEIVDNSICFNDTFPCYWCSPYSDFGYSDKLKLLNEISLVSHYDCVITVKYDKKIKNFNIKGRKN